MADDKSNNDGEGADAPQEDDLALTNPEDFGQDFAGEQFDEAEESFQQQSALGGGPAVAAAPGKMMIMIFGGGAIVLFLLYQLIFSGDDAPPPEQNQSQQAASVAAPDANIPTISQPSLIPPPLPEPEPQVIAPPTLPPLPTEPSEAETLSGPEINFAAQRPTNEQMMQRRQSAMLIMGSGGGGVATQQQPQMSNGVPVTTQAQRVQATQVGNLNHLILQGKLIKAVLETAIDSTLPGPLRAIVSRDVYAEAGNEVLIPKGSRLIGNYGTDLVSGQARVFIVWSRVIRPDGIDLNMESPVTDRLGRAGINGHVDSRFFEIFSGALLSSVFTIGTAYVGNEIAPGQVGTTQTPEGGVQVQGDPVSLATLGAAEQLALTAQGVLSNFFDMRPLITIDQGTPVNVFVNQDLEFPQSILSQVRMIQ